jgi:hypothetical protein
MSAEIIERLKKLLRLAHSSNPHESALAMQKAMELAAEHRIALDQVNPDHEAPRFTHRHHEEHFVRLPHEHQFAANICTAFFRVRSIITTVCRTGRDGWPQRRETVALVGTETDVEIANYVLGFLVHHFRFCWRKHRGRCRNRYAFMHGMFLGLHSKLSEKYTAPVGDQENALVVSMENYVGAHFGKLTSKGFTSPSATAAQMAGWHQGRKTEIRDGIKPGAAAPLALQ